MKEFNITNENEGRKVVRVISRLMPDIPVYKIQKALKNKDISINGKRVSKDIELHEGDFLKVYINENDVSAKNEKNTKNSIFEKAYTIVYQDTNALIVNKPQGVTVHPGKDTPQGTTLIEILRNKTKNEALTLVHRLDRNTGGLVLLSKSRYASTWFQEALKTQQLVKRYRCLVKGIPDVGEPVYLSDGDMMLEIRAFWERVDKTGEVFIHEEKQENDLPVITRYRVLNVYTDIDGSNEPISELEVELVTGRTHQIRAHLAFIGHPILGDGKYGRNEFNLQFKTKAGNKLKSQQLFATKLMFGKDLPKGLKDLKNKVFAVEPDYSINLKKHK